MTVPGFTADATIGAGASGAFHHGLRWSRDEGRGARPMQGEAVDWSVLLNHDPLTPWRVYVPKCPPGYRYSEEWVPDCRVVNGRLICDGGHYVGSCRLMLRTVN